jgi:pimeloyl-ACP methyl ester carboxylesterase
MTAIHTQRAALSQVKLNDAEAGAPDAPVLFLLHGWPQTWREWSLVIPVMANQYRVIVRDLRGLGDSSRPDTGYDMLRVETDLIELADHLGIERSGWSGTTSAPWWLMRCLLIGAAGLSAGHSRYRAACVFA